MSKHSLNSFFLWWIALCLPLFSSFSQALTTDWQTNPQQPEAQVRLLVSGEVNPQDKTVKAALEVKLSEGWKTYWRTPGEAGIPPEINWKINEENGSSNLETVEWHWPLPVRMELLGISTFGYYGDTLFPLEFKVSDLDQPVNIQAQLRLSSCTTICVLTDYDLNLTFTPSQLQLDSEAAFAIDKALSQVPSQMPDTGLSVESIHWDKSDSTVVVSATSPEGWNQSRDIILDGVEDITFSTPEIAVKDQQLQATMTAESWLGEVDLSQKELMVTVVNGTNATELELPVTEGSVVPLTSTSLIEFITILGFALLGGLILNLMPCVLPVLGMKLSSVVNASGQSASTTRKQFLSSAAGILTSFWLLAAFIWILKLTGNSVGWGIQFQSPWFIGFMIAVTTAFAANLLDMFEIQLPSFLSTRIATAGDDSTGGHFIQGMFATLLATPCSAPFLGTAVAFALSSDTLSLFAIFTALGIGLALPYLLIALRPAFLKWMPKPGSWMITLRRVLAIMLLLTTLWLISLLKVYVSVLWLLILALIPCLLIIYRLLALQMPNTGKGLLTLPALFLSMALVLAGAWSTGLFKSEKTPDNLTWQPLNEQQIQKLVAEGKTVFVDVTADWCVTCKANKIRVIDRDPVNDQLQADNIVLMKGDWTRPSDEINRFLQKNGRFGVPFNIIYGPGAPDGLPLPVILDQDGVIQALRQASSNR